MNFATYVQARRHVTLISPILLRLILPFYFNLFLFFARSLLKKCVSSVYIIETIKNFLIYWIFGSGIEWIIFYSTIKMYNLQIFSFCWEIMSSHNCLRLTMIFLSEYFDHTTLTRTKKRLDYKPKRRSLNNPAFKNISQKIKKYEGSRAALN